MISILLVDDEPALLDVAQIFLEKGGTMKVTLSESGYNALQVLKSGNFDIIVSDYEMPGMNGIDLLKAVKSGNPDIPFIIFTGRGREHVAIEALNYGASFYLQKGGDPKSQFAELKNMIDQAVNRKKAEEEVKLNESRLSAIIDLYRMTSATRQEFSNYALEKAIELTKSRIGYLAFLNEDETVLNIYAWSRQAMDECRISNKPLEYPVSKTGLWGEAVRQRRAIITNEYAADNPLKKGCPDGHVHLSRHMNVPVFDGNRIVIVAGVANKQQDYDNNDVTQITLLMGALWQIIKRNRAENELVAEKKRLQSYFDHPLVGIVTTSPGMKWLSVNEKFSSMFGYSRDELAVRSWTDITLPGEHENEIKTHELVISGELQDKTLRKKYIRKDGSEISVEVSSMPVRNEAGDVEYIVSFVQDISGLIRTQEELVGSNLQMTQTLGELKETQASLSDYCSRLEQEEKSLKESEERYRSLVENISTGIFRTSAGDGWELQSTSTGFLRMLGYDTRDTINGTPFIKLFSDEHEFMELSGAVTAEGFARGYEAVLKKKDGGTIPVQITAIIKQDNPGTVCWVDVMVEDLTRRKAAEEAISMMNRKLTLLGRMTRHDVNNRLAVLSGYLDLTREIVDDPTVLSYIRKEERALTAILHLLNFSGSYQDVGMKEPSWQDAADAVRKSAHLLELRSVTVYLDIHGLEVYADPLFEKVFYNLIENALEYGKKISKIVISASESGDCLTIVVEDDGVGVAGSEKERIFEAGVGQNTGYGLFLVREILSITGFSIRETGVQNAGAKFEIKIPAGYYRFS
jgi:PAS domain S-box-containing protein